jgi:hypothetical protein
MNFTRKILLVILGPALIILPNQGYAQQKIRLPDVKEIMLVVQTGGFSTDYFRRLDIKYENGQWNCYQKQRYSAYDLKTKRQINDTVVKLIKAVPERTLKKLVRLINQNDPTIHLRLFKIRKSELIKDIDSMDFKIGPNMFKLDSTKHERLEKLVRLKAVVDTATLEALHPRRMDDEDHYTLRFIRTADTIMVQAFSFAYPYYLPWHIGKRLSYDPRITIMFEDLRDNKNFSKNQSASFHKEIDRTIYIDYFSKRRKKSMIRSKSP